MSEKDESAAVESMGGRSGGIPSRPDDGTDSEQVPATPGGTDGTDALGIANLPFFPPFSRLFALHGTGYSTVKKLCAYLIAGVVLSRDKIEDGRVAVEKLVCVGDTWMDTRINVIIVLPSGHGKGNIVYVLEKCMSDLDLRLAKVTSLHSEQLVGKVVMRSPKKKKPEFIPNPGHLDEPLVILDDAAPFFKNDARYEEAYRYSCQAADPLGKNRIYKRAVDILRGEELSYYPACSQILFIQPMKIRGDFIQSGFLRRFLVAHPTVPIDSRLQGTKERLNANPVAEEDWQTVGKAFRSLAGKDGGWRFSDEVRDLLADRTESLFRSFCTRSLKVEEYVKIILYDIQNHLIRMSTILASFKGRTDVLAADVEGACHDLREILNSQLRFVQNYVSWRPLKVTDHPDWVGDTLRLLQREIELAGGATTTISGFQEAIARENGITGHGARKRYRVLLDDGLILSESQTRPTKVWLSEEGLTALEIINATSTIDDTEEEDL